jgi:hypothetical protein
MRVDPEVLTSVVPKYLRDGWQVVSDNHRRRNDAFHRLFFFILGKNIHAIGDYANSVVLDTFEAALKDVNVTALRPRLEHAQILTKADMERVGKLGGEQCSVL